VTVRTVLIVEDEWAIADWLEVLLSENGYNVLSAGNGRAALDILHRETPDLVLTDFMMPFVDGAGLIAAMQGNPATRDIPIVVMTSLLESVVRDRVVGYRAYLRKPFREADLMKVVGEILGSA
jgi:CheY-like chemotaxis protein